MDELFRSVHDFLADPAAQRDEFDASDALIWVDWGDEDESVLSYLNDVLPENAQIDYECTDAEEERGFDILLKKDGEVRVIPYAADAADALLALSKRGRAGEIYNIANGGYRPLRDYIEEARAMIAPQCDVAYGTADADVFSLQPSVEKICRDTGWLATTDFEGGMQKILLI